ncbi:MAG: S8 family serine peptidase [Candidatus Limnocylindrales bacterium]
MAPRATFLSLATAALLLAASVMAPAAAAAPAPPGGPPPASGVAPVVRELPPRAPAPAARVLQDGLAMLAQGSVTFPAGLRRTGAGAAAGTMGPELAVSIQVAPEERTAVEAAMAALGGRVANRDPLGFEAYVPQRALAPLAGVSGVESVTPILPPVPAGTLTDAIALQGAATWQAAGTAGAGVRIGILDAGFSGIGGLLGVDLPSSVHARCYTAVGAYTSSLSACGQAGEAHGTAVAEVVAAMAPAASLWIADPTSQDDLLASIDWMTSNGVRIINASWTDTGFEGPGDGTSPYADTAYTLVNRAVSEGALWVNAAGNSGDQGWIGPWREDARGWLEFSGTDTSNRLTLQQGDHVAVSMRWSDPWGHASDDYDLGLYMAGDPVPVAFSSNVQNGTGDPVETLEYDVPWTGQYEISAHRHSGGAAARVQLIVQSDSEAPLQYQVPTDTLTAPADGRSPGMLVVGAVDLASPGVVEDYSGRGPTLDGRIKPDLVAVDCADTQSLAPFCGTSEATPFVTGAAADLLSANPTWTTSQLIVDLTQHATAIGAPVPNATAGYGRLTMGPPPNVPASLRFLQPPLGALAGSPILPQPAVEILDGRGQRVTAGPGASLTVTLSAAAGPGGSGVGPAGLTAGPLVCSGGTTVAAVAGVATFTGCTLAEPVAGAVLSAQAAGLPPVSSAAFNVVDATTPIPSLSITPSARTVTWGSGVTLGLQLALPNGAALPPGAAVVLQTSTDSVLWRTMATLPVDAAGAASISYRPATNLWYRAAAPAAPGLGPGVSPPSRVVVRQIALLRPTYGTSVRVVTRGTTVTFTTTIRPSRPELRPPVAEFRVYRQLAGGWTLAADVSVGADAAGVATLPWRFATAGSWYVASAALPLPLNANSVWSPPDRILVR